MYASNFKLMRPPRTYDVAIDMSKTTKYDFSSADWLSDKLLQTCLLINPGCDKSRQVPPTRSADFDFAIYT